MDWSSRTPLCVALSLLFIHSASWLVAVEGSTCSYAISMYGSYNCEEFAYFCYPSEDQSGTCLNLPEVGSLQVSASINCDTNITTYYDQANCTGTATTASTNTACANLSPLYLKTVYDPSSPCAGVARTSSSALLSALFACFRWFQTSAQLLW